MVSKKMKRRLALLAVLAGANGLSAVHAFGDPGGNCSSCGDIVVAGHHYDICVSNLANGYQSCLGGFGTELPCVNSAFSCSKDPEDQD